MHTDTTPLKIGIIDSGISADFLRATSINVMSGATFQIDWEQKKLHSFFCDKNDIINWRNNITELVIADQSGHGTAVASILYQNIPFPVEFYIAKILDEQVSGSAICLLAAMKWLLQQIGAQYINLSLGTTNWQLHPQMIELVAEAQLKNCQLFAAAGDIPTLPSELAGVTAVGIAGAQLHNTTVKVDCIAPVSSVVIFRDNKWVEVDLSTSFACPLMLAEHCSSHA